MAIFRPVLGTRVAILLPTLTTLAILPVSQAPSIGAQAAVPGWRAGSADAEARGLVLG